MAELDKAIQMQKDILENPRSSMMDKAAAVELLKGMTEVSDRWEAASLAESVSTLEEEVKLLKKAVNLLLQGSGKAPMGFGKSE